LEVPWSVERPCPLLAEPQSQSEKSWILVQREHFFGEKFVSYLIVHLWGHKFYLLTTETSWPCLGIVAAGVVQTKIRASPTGNWKENF